MEGGDGSSLKLGGEMCCDVLCELKMKNQFPSSKKRFHKSTSRPPLLRRAARTGEYHTRSHTHIPHPQKSNASDAPDAPRGRRKRGRQKPVPNAPRRRGRGRKRGQPDGRRRPSLCRRRPRLEFAPFHRHGRGFRASLLPPRAIHVRLRGDLRRIWRPGRIRSQHPTRGRINRWNPLSWHAAALDPGASRGQHPRRRADHTFPPFSHRRATRERVRRRG